MLKHSLVYLVMSILIVIFAKYAHNIIVHINMFFAFIDYHLAPIFSHTAWGLLIRKIIILVLLPLLIVAIPALLYRLIRGQDMPHFIAAVWIIWTVIVFSNIVLTR